MRNYDDVLDFLKISNNLKKTLRFRENKKMASRESSADHSWHLALMTIIAVEKLKLEVDLSRAVKIALVHDLPEAITGDIDLRLIVSGKFSKEEKDQLEITAMKKIESTLSGSTGKELYNLWFEYFETKTKEAKFVKAMDKLETMNHLVNEGNKAFDFSDVIATFADDYVREFPELKNMLEELKLRLKKEYKKGKIPWKKEYDYSLAD